MAVLVQLDGIARRVDEEGLAVVIDTHGVADDDTATRISFTAASMPVTSRERCWPMLGGIGASSRCTC